MAWTIIAYFLISICENIEGSSFSVSENKTWIEAHQFCKDNDSNLISNVSDVPAPGSYWTGNLIRKSDWIHILGCYDERVFRKTPIRVRLQTESVGRCQEYCRFNNCTHFGVQRNICACIKELNISSTVKRYPHFCNHQCSNDVDGYLKDCGGNGTYNLYKWSHRTGGNGNCLKLECQGNPSINDDDCTQSLKRVCESKNASIKGTEKRDSFNWEQSLKKCKFKNEYLMGNLNITDKMMSCQAVNSIIHTGPHWIGVRREEYKTIDIGQFIEEESITEVMVCNNGKCNFTSFESSSQYNVVCSKNKSPELLPVSPDVPATPVTPKTTDIGNTNATVVQTTPTIFMTTDVQNTNAATNNSYQKENADDQPVASIAVPVTIVLTCFGVAFVIIFLLIRKRKLKAEKSKNMSYKTKNHLVKPVNGNLNYTMPNQHPNSQETSTKEYEEAKNDYFVLEPAADCYELADNCILEQENPYTDGEEGTYDQLRNTKVRKREEEDTYQHATLTDIAETSDYDTSGHMRRQDIDSTYDHANANMIALKSDNTYNTLENV